MVASRKHNQELVSPYVEIHPNCIIKVFTLKNVETESLFLLKYYVMLSAWIPCLCTASNLVKALDWPIITNRKDGQLKKISS